MSQFLWASGLTAMLAAGIAAIAGALLPSWRPIMVGLVVLLALLVIDAGVVLVFVAQVGPPAPGRVDDSSAMLIGIFTMFGAAEALLCVVIGWPVATWVARLRKHRR